MSSSSSDNVTKFVCVPVCSLFLKSLVHSCNLSYDISRALMEIRDIMDLMDKKAEQIKEKEEKLGLVATQILFLLRIIMVPPLLSCLLWLQCFHPYWSLQNRYRTTYKYIKIQHTQIFLQTTIIEGWNFPCIFMFRNKKRKRSFKKKKMCFFFHPNPPLDSINIERCTRFHDLPPGHNTIMLINDQGTF